MPSTLPTPTDADPRLLNALASLNQIGAAINRIGPGDYASSAPSPGSEQDTSPARGVKGTLQLIAESAIKVLPGASAVIFTYDPIQRACDPASRVSVGELVSPIPHDEPRADGMGMRAISQRRLVLSYEEQDLDIHPIKVDAGARVVACFPLIMVEQPVGVLYVYLHQARRFSQLELLMLENFVNQAAMTIYQARRLADVQRNLARKEDELNRLRHAGMLISSRLELEETLETILQMALEVTNAQYGIFRLVDKSGQNLVTRAFAGECLDQPQVETLPLAVPSIMGWVAKNRQPLCIHDLQTEPWSRIYYPLDADMEMRSELAVPLIGASGKLEGVLNLESPVVGAFSEQDRHLLQSLATQAVIAIQEVRLLDALKEVAELLLTQSRQQVLNHLVELACDLLNSTASAIWTLEDELLILQVASPGYQRDEAASISSRQVSRAIASRSPVLIDNAPPSQAATAPSQYWTRALIVPLLARDVRQPIGAFVVYSTESDPDTFAASEWDKKVLTCLADYAALAVRSAAYQEALRAAQEQHAVAETFAAVGDIAANVLHHLNNKVGTIPVRVQGIQDKCQPALLADHYLATNLQEIERSASEAMESVRENLSHLHPIRLAPVDVSACVSAAIRAAKLPAGITIQIENLDSLPAVVAGQRSLTLVFINLLENAADAMQGNGLLTIQGAVDDDRVQIALSDNGPGIAPELHDEVFEFSFSDRRAAGTPGPYDRTDGKLGFGLWWVKTMMVRLGGSVAVESDGCSGTTLRLELPIAKGPA